VGPRRWQLKVVPVLAIIGAVAIVGGTIAITRNYGSSSHPAVAGQPRLVVLPFQNEGTPTDTYFADGLTEAITNRLAGLHNLGVIDPRSANQYKDTKATPKQIGRDLGVQYILEGTVRWGRTTSGAPEVEIIPTLVNAGDETTKLAPDPYVVQPSDVFKVQTDVATKVADALGVVLEQGDERTLSARATQNTDAYDFYMRARGLDERLRVQLSPTSLQDAIAEYRQAVTLDPRFAVAFAHLGEDQLLWAALDLSDKRRVTAGKASIDSALALDSTLAEAHEAEAFYLNLFAHDPDAAYSEYARAAASRPNDARYLGGLGLEQMRIGHMKEGLANLEKAVQLDPRSTDAVSSAARAAFEVRQYDVATRYADQLTRLAPDDWIGYALQMEIAARGRGDTATARRVLEAELQHVPVMTVRMLLPEIESQGRSDWPRLDSLRLPDVHPQQVLDTLNFYLAKMGVALREQAHAAAVAYADTALRVAGHTTLGGPFQSAGHVIAAICNAVVGRRAAALRGIAALDSDDVSRATEAPIRAQNAEARARAYLALGDQDHAVAELERLIALPSGVSAAGLRVDTQWTALADNPRFRALLSRAP
jgi:TolB-like protein/tetratricopeptide (TPR) repeat protein